MSERITVNAECNLCRATGVYKGYAEPDGIGVVCKACGGTGRVERSYVPFTHRKLRASVHTVANTRPPEFPGMMPKTTSVTYSEFLAGKMP